ncbi:RNA polymerase sigma factor [Kribbella sp. NPDC051718]|uniref:RNA polymerase sigma factor n=1 Tax=Kribbella sp. NPDC051718 TaxID=3155168 RepID=UPI003425873C
MSTPIAGVLMGEGTGQAVSSDLELWERLRSADEFALTELFHRYSDAVYNFAFRRTSSWSLAEDIVQATFTAVWRRASESRLDELTFGTARPLLLTVARFECANAARSSRRLSALRQRLGTLGGSTETPDHSALAAAKVDDERAMSALRRALAKVPADQREIVELVAWSGCSMAEAAQVLGVPEGTVKSRLARARRRLAGLIDLDTTEGQ